jgi:hypothetical protein
LYERGSLTDKQTCPFGLDDRISELAAHYQQMTDYQKMEGGLTQDKWDDLVESENVAGLEEFFDPVALERFEEMINLESLELLLELNH